MFREVRPGRVVAAVVAGAAALAGWGAAAASADTYGCTYGSSAGNVRTCLDVGVNRIGSDATVVSSARVLQTCLFRNGAPLLCTQFTYTRPGATLATAYLTPNGTAVPNGTYCAVTWKQQPDGSTVEIGDVCQFIAHG